MYILACMNIMPNSMNIMPNTWPACINIVPVFLPLHEYYYLASLHEYCTYYLASMHE
jgi:hypothetical protein